MEESGEWSIFKRRIVMLQFKPTQFPNLISFLSNHFFLRLYTQIPYLSSKFYVLKHIKNPQKYPKTIDKSCKNVYNVLIILDNLGKINSPS